jgi:hypothetical protein
VSEQIVAAADRLLETLAASARGPKRNGVFALWMFLRACDGMLPPQSLSSRAHRRRVQGLERRLSSLSLPAPLRRALAAGVRELGDGSAASAGIALRQLVAPVRETLGTEVAEVIGTAGQVAREATDHAPGGV